MKKDEFWKQAEIRIVENQRISGGGVSRHFAPLLLFTGLHFWKVGLCLSFGVMVWVWLTQYPLLMRVVRILIWR